MLTVKKHCDVSPSSSTNSISDIEDDILVDIICRLPIKHIVSSKCVSKLWHTLISNVCVPRVKSVPVCGLIFNTLLPCPTFTRGPWEFSPINSAFDDHQIVLDHPTPFHPSPDDLLDCCNGLLLFFDPSSRQYYVSNPTTRESIAVPNSPQNNLPRTGALIFDSDYKIVHISGVNAAMTIFSLATREWSSHYLDLVLNFPLFARHVFLDGSLYRIAGTGHLFKFDVRQIDYRAIELPPEVMTRDLRSGCIGLSQGSLHFGWSDESSKIMVWMLKFESGHIDEWVLKYTICLQYFFQHPLCSCLHDSSLFKVFAFHPTSDKMFVGNSAGIFHYDVGTTRLESVCTMSEEISIFATRDLVYPFSLNLTPLHALVRAQSEIV